MSPDPNNYRKVLKKRLKGEGSQLVTDCNQLKLKSPKDGKRYKTDVITTEQLLRLIQSIPSPMAEPFKMWLAQVGRERIEETIDPELTTTTEISKQKAPGSFQENIEVARAGGKVAGDARKAVEAQTGVPIITSKNASQLNQDVVNLIESGTLTAEDPKEKKIFNYSEKSGIWNGI